MPFRADRRAAAGVTPGQPYEATVALDTEPRVVDAPTDLRAALKAAGAWDRWETLSFTRKREYAEAITGAKKPDTRARRIGNCVSALRR